MCDRYTYPTGIPKSETSEEKLAKLMNRDLGTAISSRELRLFLKAHWSKVATLAHAIHETE